MYTNKPWGNIEAKHLLGTKVKGKIRNLPEVNIFHAFSRFPMGEKSSNQC